MAATTDLRPGYDEPVLAAQSAFRQILSALSRPGTIETVDLEEERTPAPLNAASTNVALTLLDNDTPVWLSETLKTPDILAYIRFHTGAPIVALPEKAAFAFTVAEELETLSAFNIGNDLYPETSTTVIVQLPSLGAGATRLELSGPGIETTNSLALGGMGATLWDEWRDNTALFPCGIDMILTANDRLAALPRTTKAILTEKS